MKTKLGLITLILNLIIMNTYSQDDFITTPSGLQYKIHKKGIGTIPKEGDKVRVHYQGKLTDNTLFDSSYKRGNPFEFELGKGRVIKGWDEGIALLNEGDSATFIIPPDLGYGNRSMSNIPANSTLIFNVELIKVIPDIPVVEFDTKGKDTITTESGLQYIIVEKAPANALKVAENKKTKVHYTGYFLDGRVFDSSIKRGEPISIIVGKGMVIKGWEEGLELMSVGDKARLIIPYNLAYGEEGRPPIIPQRTDLIFDVEIIDAETLPVAVPYKVEGKDTVSTESGLKYIVVEEVSRKNSLVPKNGQNVSVHYTGYFEDGKIFDSSIERGQPISFVLGQGAVIKGWDEGIAIMRKGEKFRLLIPYDLAYGEQGYPGAIPPKSNLIFDVELVDIK